MTEKVLVTGGFGLVGSQTVRRLAADGHRVVATDLGTPAQRKAAESLPAGAAASWANLTDQHDVDRLITEVSPTAIVHLAAVIPPAAYRHPQLARRVNVDATAALLRAAEASEHPPRFVLASSNAVYGSRNPHRHPDRLRVDSPLRPADLYGAHKVVAENQVRASSLEWVILRLGGVDVRDVAAAFAAATTADVAGETLLIAGDDSHLHRQKEVGLALAAARGLPNVLPAGRPGDPGSDENWFVTDWLDTARAQQALSFQHHSWPDMLAEMRVIVGWKRYPMFFVGPVVRQLLKRQAAYRDTPGRYADPWGAIRSRLGEPGPDQADGHRTTSQGN
jgi:nucleoside-diphosphate-sugar epimerase